jgi:hypothetical protein
MIGTCLIRRSPHPLAGLIDREDVALVIVAPGDIKTAVSPTDGFLIAGWLMVRLSASPPNRAEA